MFISTDVSAGLTFGASRTYSKTATNKPPILICPPHGQGAFDATTYGWAGHIFAALAEAGYPILSGDMAGPSAYGNAASATAVGTARGVATSVWGAPAGTCGLFFTSMGTLAALRYAKDNPAAVACACGGVPLIDLSNVYSVTRTDLQGEIDAAHGGHAGYTSYLSAYNPATQTASYMSLPMQLHYSTNDPNITPSTVTNFASATGAQAISLGAVGHDPSFMDASTVVKFFQANL